MNTQGKENRAIPTHTIKHTNTHRLRHSEVINGRCPLCLKSHWRDSGSPNTRNSSRGRPVKSNILLHSSREDRGGKSDDGGKGGGTKGVHNSVREDVLLFHTSSDLIVFVPMSAHTLFASSLSADLGHRRPLPSFLLQQ